MELLWWLSAYKVFDESLLLCLFVIIFMSQPKVL